MALNAIVFDAGTQVRAAIDPELVSEYAASMTDGWPFPPIVLFTDGNQYYLADGFHRFMAARRLTLPEIAADVQPGTKQDALWFALGANKHKQNGKRLNSTDLRHAIELAFRTWPERSAREVAAQIGCTDSYVGDVKKQVQAILHLNLPDRVVGKDGKSYPATQPNPKRQAIAEMTRAGASRDSIVAALSVSPSTVTAVRKTLGLGPTVSITRADVQKRAERMQVMAREGYTSRQMAAEFGISDEACRENIRKLGIVVPADKVTSKSHRHDANRIVEHIVMDAENLTADVHLVDLASLDRERLGGWIDSLVASKRSLDAFIRKLTKEHQKHGEAA